jgi:enoyl-CoA hydratase/carnithine racemase
MLKVEDSERVRTLTLDRPEALNAFSGALYDATAVALDAAAADPDVAVVVLTGSGRAFCAGTDIGEMGASNQGGGSNAEYGFPGLMDRVQVFEKPLVCAVNGIGVGIGATILGHADLVFMSADARLRCPFTALGVAPEAASSYTFPRLLGRFDATWVLMSSEWIDAETAKEIGLVWKVCAPDDLLDVTLRHAKVLAAQPIASLIESKRAIVAPLQDQISAARAREDAAFGRLLGGPANSEAIAAFIEKRDPDFRGL